MTAAGFIAARCPCCLREGAILIECVPEPGRFGVCLQCGAVVYFASATSVGADGQLCTALALVDGSAALQRTSKSEAHAVLALLDKAAALVQAQPERGHA